MLTAAGAIAATLAGLTSATTMAAAALPNACRLLPAHEVLATTGRPPAALAPLGKRAEIDGFATDTCTYRRGKLKLSVLVAPAAFDNGGSSNLPGSVIRKPPDLGPKGIFAYDNRPRYQFANVVFVAGPYFVGIDSTGIANAKILAVGRYVYAHRRDY